MFNVGHALGVYKKKLGLTTAQVASEIHVSRGFLSTIESHHRLPTLSLDFVKPVSFFLQEPESVVMSCIAIEHFLANMKFDWLEKIITKNITEQFRVHYLRQDGNNERILPTGSEIQTTLLMDTLEKNLDLLCSGGLVYLPPKNPQEFTAILKLPKKYFYLTDSLFTLHESMLFIKSFTIGENSFNYDFHMPVGSLETVSSYISPYNDPYIRDISLPLREPLY